MQHPFKDATNKQFGRLTALRRFGHSQDGIVWECKCECGNITRVSYKKLNSGNTKSCGCLVRDTVIKRSTKHGDARRGRLTREYRIWYNIKQRCYNPKTFGYKYYGARGISLCKRWYSSFYNFLKDMGRCPEGMTIDRINNDGAYTPSNCRWATRLDQMNNMRGNHAIMHDGIVLNVCQWSRKNGINNQTLCSRLTRGWPVKLALTIKPSLSNRIMRSN
jgi:hypothetical protein